MWTVNDDNAIRSYLRVPVDGIITDRPDAVYREQQNILGEQGAAPWLRDALNRFTLL